MLQQHLYTHSAQRSFPGALSTCCVQWGGGHVNDLNSGDYSVNQSLLWALGKSVCSRLFLCLLQIIKYIIK